MRIGILIVAYNAASTLAQVLDRIPAEFRARVDEILICDDHSQDSTYLVGLGYQQLTKDLPITVIRHPANLGYGGNQKAGYNWAIEHGLDIVVLLHGDGQYAPEILADIVAPLERGECDAVLGSRMLETGAARRGGMPLYKYVGNRILTSMENALVGTKLSEWHSGYRAYRVDALRFIPFQDNSDDFDFDTQVIIQLLEAGLRIGEVPIPTYYGDEICYVDGLRYARDVTRDVMRYRAHKMGFGTGATAFASQAYEFKEGEDTSHGTVLAWMGREPGRRVLDLGCSGGALAAQLRKLGHYVIGVDATEVPGVREATDEFFLADLDTGLPADLEGSFDVVVAADVLEHVRSPEILLGQVRSLLAPGGWVLVSIPNFVHFYPRIRIALGLFDYDRRGILDADHVRFFTRRSFERLARSQDFVVRRSEPVGLPLEVLRRGGDSTRSRSGWALHLIGRLGRLMVALRPNLFAYQYVMRLEPLG
ncbi:MAG: methyltransferase domain-containing protein [Acidimicrobiales bacterium]